MTSIREAILAAAAVPQGEAELLGQKVRIRGVTAGEEADHLQDGLDAGIFPVCAACIVDEAGKPLFTVDELRALKGGTLKEVYMDILKLSYPKAAKDVVKNS